VFISRDFRGFAVWGSFVRFAGFEGIVMQPFLEPAERLMLIRDGLYSDDAAVQRRASMILDLDDGSNFRRVARSAQCDRSTVKFWYYRYLERRSTAALRSASDRYRRYDDHLNHAARARSLVLLAESRTERRLPWSADQRAGVERDARLASDPDTRYRQAIRFALDRGVSPSLIARAALCRNSDVYELRSREITGLTRWQRRARAVAAAGV
jgi:hypothetical protein